MKACLNLLVLASIANGVNAGFWVDWSTSTCVPDNPSRQPWDELYGSLASCCAKALWWVEDCEVTQSPTARPTHSPFTGKPTDEPTDGPTHRPTTFPSKYPTTLWPISTPTDTTSFPTSSPIVNKNKVEVKPTADCFISESRPSSNYGRRKMLQVRAKRGAQESLLKFELTPMHGKCIEKATLSLYSLIGAVSGGEISRLVPKGLFADANIRWEEEDATWRSIKSKTKGSNVLKRIGRVRRNSWVDIDVTAGIDNEQLTFLITSSGAKAKYASKESGKFSPKLTLTLC